MPTTKKNDQNRKRKNDKASSEEASNTFNGKAFKDWLKVCEATRKRLEREA